MRGLYGIFHAAYSGVKVFIIPHREMKSLIQLRMDGVLYERNPILSPMPESNHLC